MKKCGTKSLLTFLLSHPSIIGRRQEYHYFNTNNFELDFGAFLGQMKPFNATDDQIVVTKTGFNAVNEIAAGYEKYKKSNKFNENYWIDQMVQPTVSSWAENVKILVCLCDPVKRLRSDFLHVKAEHPDSKPMNKDKFGPNSAIFPFRDLNFNSFVDTYVRKRRNLPKDSPIKSMIDKVKSHYYFPQTSTQNITQFSLTYCMIHTTNFI